MNLLATKPSRMTDCTNAVKARLLEVVPRLRKRACKCCTQDARQCPDGDEDSHKPYHSSMPSYGCDSKEKDKNRCLHCPKVEYKDNVRAVL